MRAVQEEVGNYTTKGRSLWPSDYMPDVIVRVMVAKVTDMDTARMNIITRFLYTIILKNAAGPLKKSPQGLQACARNVHQSAGTEWGDR
jgi:hypothetical protein